jgi:hypothetical protein
MEYYKYIDEEVNIGRIMYGEFDEEYYCIRAVFEENKIFFSSNFIYDDYILPEGSYDDIKEYLGEKITEEEFNEIWVNSLKPFFTEWNKVKNKYSIDEKINTKINCIYPQGIVFDINEKFYGIADYEKCKTKYGSKYLCSGNKMEMYIIGYDENNMWVKLNP